MATTTTTTLVLLPNTTYFMAECVKRKLEEAPSAFVITTRHTSPGWVSAHAPHAKVVSLDDDCPRLILESRPSLVVTDLVVYNDPLYDSILAATRSVKADVWSIMQDSCITRQVLQSADTAWVPKGSRWINAAVASRNVCRVYDADALYLKHDEACRASDEGEANIVISGHARNEPRQATVRLASNGHRVTLIAGFGQCQAQDFYVRYV
jgi:hypothetical protein